ncbi:tetratricopeptide repeat protein [Alkalicoccus daliensis]|uniref:Uncharacterized protein n=1 Tax=Alkalicoccus daliensis TaxID=745820 RepID=A0A1H0E8C1_9BACI|nr:hypothetical protein [Alkalicoccus daliensis]SDN78571.1 hypothetical protein SAMN04488053_103242 [Alkalicoccus daliensis]
MRSQVKKLDELYMLEEEILENRDTATADGTFSKLLGIYEQMHRLTRVKAGKSREPADISEYEFIKNKKLLPILIKYGTYLKMGHVKDPYQAKNTLERVLKLDNMNPIALYRLGFLAYAEKEYSTAANYFQQAIDAQRSPKVEDWQLNGQQLYHANLYLVNSSLFIAKETSDRLEQMEPSGETLEQYEKSPFFHIIQENEAYLHRHGFVKHTKEEKTFCSREDCDDTFDNNPENVIIIYFSDGECSVAFNQKKRTLNANYARMLKDFLMKSSKENSLILEEVIDHFSSSDIQSDTYSQRIRRLRVALDDYGLSHILENDRSRRNPDATSRTAYYYNEEYPYIIMERVEDELD